MDNCEFLFWVRFKPENCVDDLKVGSKKLAFIEGIKTPKCLRMGMDSHFNSLPWRLVPGDHISYDYFPEHIPVMGGDASLYYVEILGSLIVTKVRFAVGDCIERSGVGWEINIDCYCDEYRFNKFLK